MESSTWAVSDHAVHPAAEDDFHQFLDMNGMANLTDGVNYDFQDFQPSAGPQLLQSHPREQLDIPMSGTDAPILLSPAVPPMQHQMPAITSAAAYQTIPATMMPPPTPTDAIADSIDAQIQFLQQQKLRHQQQRQIEEQQVVFFTRQQSQMVPPTPQSLEIQPGANQYYTPSSTSERQQQQQQQPRSVEYRYQRLKDQTDMSFTPLVSPAVTPLDTHFSVDPQFAAVSGAYFSPLTSPALHAQHDPLAMFDHLHSAVTTSSPVDMELDTANAPSAPSATPGDLAKKIRKNAAKARAKSVKQSPISKPLRRRTTTTPSLNAQVLSELAETAAQNTDPQLLPTSMMQTSSSSTTGPTDSEDSVSPEALNDHTTPVEMPPPPIPKPRSARPSPYIAPQTSAAPNALQPPRPGLASPATPASLMKLSSPSSRSVGTKAGSQEVVDTDHIETFELPESANFLNRTGPATDGPTPTQTSHDNNNNNNSNTSKTPTLALPPSPSLIKPSGPASATQSPLLLAGTGPSTTTTTTIGAKRTPQLLPRGSSKKRGSVSSSIPVSPALRPKISPSIKPLLPGGPDVEEAASHLLATKSNYQRILEGNTVPGVSYPSELSTNLTSKRTSHKIAEQGRRNRINSALQEIATLLPRQPAAAGREAGGGSEGEGSDGKGRDGKERGGSVSGGGGGGGSGGAPNSKASTVEMAIEYIKQLQREVAEANRRAEEAEKRLEMKGEGKTGGD